MFESRGAIVTLRGTSTGAETAVPKPTTGSARRFANRAPAPSHPEAGLPPIAWKAFFVAFASVGVPPASFGTLAPPLRIPFTVEPPASPSGEDPDPLLECHAETTWPMGAMGGSGGSKSTSSAFARVRMLVPRAFGDVARAVEPESGKFEFVVSPTAVDAAGLLTASPPGTRCVSNRFGAGNGRGAGSDEPALSFVFTAPVGGTTIFGGTYPG